MSRLTYKDTKVSGGYNAVDTDEYACVVKLGKYEDLEEELGCPLEVVFKALKQECVYNYFGEKLFVDSFMNVNDSFFRVGNDEEKYYLKDSVNGGSYPLSEYKKTWWLKKDKSE